MILILKWRIERFLTIDSGCGRRGCLDRVFEHVETASWRARMARCVHCFQVSMSMLERKRRTYCKKIAAEMSELLEELASFGDPWCCGVCDMCPRICLPRVASQL